MNKRKSRTKQRGTVLVIGLLILLSLTILAIAGLNTVATELTMARNDRNNETVFQAAESALEQALALGTFDTSAAVEVVLTNDAKSAVSVVVEFKETTQLPGRPGDEFAPDRDSGIIAYHFVATATAILQGSTTSASNPGVSAIHHQGFYVPGPAGVTSPSNNPVRTYWLQDGVQ